MSVKFDCGRYAQECQAKQLASAITEKNIERILFTYNQSTKTQHDEHNEIIS